MASVDKLENGCDSLVSRAFPMSCPMVVVLVEVGFVRSVEEAGTGNETGFLWERFWLEGVEGIDSNRSCALNVG